MTTPIQFCGKSVAFFVNGITHARCADDCTKYHIKPDESVLGSDALRLCVFIGRAQNTKCGNGFACSWYRDDKSCLAKHNPRQECRYGESCRNRERGCHFIHPN